MIDLHLHTTVSDGRATPLELVDLAVAHGLTVMAVTDHDTTGAVADVKAFATARGIEAVPGIEITAVLDGRDVHMLAYFIDTAHEGFEAFLRRQRTSRLARVEALGDRLASLGMPVDLQAVLAMGRLRSNISIGRPQVAKAMIAAGYVVSAREAFERWLGTGRPAFVPRIGPSPEDVIGVVHEAGGLLSLAHPGRTRIDERIPALRHAGLDALEVYHSDHGEADVERYGALAAALDLLVTGGSDFHANPESSVRPGSVSLPRAEWERLLAAHAAAS